MKKSLYLRVFCLLTLFFSLSGSLVARNVRLKLAVIVPESSVWGKEFNKAAKEITKKTDGRIKFRIYYGGVQGDELVVIKKMRIGQLHGAGFMARGMSKVVPESLVFAIPLLFYNEDEAIEVHKKMEGYFDKEARARGYEILGWSNQGFTYAFSKDYVTDINQLRQARPWTLENDAFCQSFIKNAKISAVPLQVGDVMTALQSGMIHTVFSPPIGMILMQWHTRVKYFLDLGIFYSFGGVVLTQKAWKKISPDDQKIVKSAFQKALHNVNKAVAKQNEEALKVMSKNIKFLKPTKEGLKEFRGITDLVEKEMTGKAFSPEAMELMKKYLKEYRAQHAENKK